MKKMDKFTADMNSKYNTRVNINKTREAIFKELLELYNARDCGIMMDITGLDHIDMFITDNYVYIVSQPYGPIDDISFDTSKYKIRDIPMGSEFKIIHSSLAGWYLPGRCCLQMYRAHRSSFDIVEHTEDKTMHVYKYDTVPTYVRDEPNHILYTTSPDEDS